MKRTLPLIVLLFLVAGSYRIEAVEMLVLPDGYHIAHMSHDGSRFAVRRYLRNCCPDHRQYAGTLDDPTKLNLLEASGDFAYVQNMSSSGEYIVGNTIDDQLPARWNLEGQIELLPLPVGKSKGFALGISGDDSVVVGYAYGDGFGHAYRWTIGGDVASLSPLPDFDESYAVGVSADGRVAVGMSGRGDNEDRISQLTMWIHHAPDAVETISLGLLDGQTTNASLLSRDGTVVAGYGYDGEGNTAFRWTNTEGIVSLGKLPGATSTLPKAMSSDGKLIVGGGGFGDLLENPSWVWDERHRMRNLATVLIDEHGVDPAIFDPVHGRFLLQDMSDDGTALSALYYSDGRASEWGNVAIYLDRPLVVTSGVTGDFSGDAELDAADLDLLTAELRTDRNVDLFDVNADGDVNTADRAFWVTDLSGTYFGDANLDRTVDFSDFLSLSAHFGEEAGWANGDFDGNGQTDFPDFLLLSENFGASSASASTASVPEPSSCLLLTICLLAFCRKLPRRQIGRDMVQGVI